MSFLSDGTFFYKNAGESWSQSTPSEGTYRFEVQGNDYYSSTSIPIDQSDEAQGKNRSELVTLQKLQEGRAFTFDFDFMVESGATNTADWLLLAQFHQTEDIAPDGTLIDTAAASPPLALQLRGERLEIVGRVDQNAATTVSPPNIQMYLATDPIIRGQFYNIRFEMVFDDATGGDGMLRVFLDGVQIVDYSGPIGYNDAIGTYAQFGVYREQSPETFAAQFRNLSLTSTEPAPQINGTSGNDSLDADQVGFLENEVLNGYAGDDTLSGGYGADTMNGGAGNDLYIVNDAGDVVNERSGGVDQGGEDTVQSYVSWTLGLDTESLTLWASDNIDGTGNAKSNVMRGNTGNNVLSGLGGNDSILGDQGNDTLHGGDGDDTLLGGEGNDTLNGDAGADRLMGEAGNDRLNGGAGNDTLEGGAGTDTLDGGAGDDDYTIDDITDVIIETADGGRDTLRTSVSYDASASGQVEVLNTTNQSGTGTINLSGTNLDNEIRGNNGTNRLVGRAGNDLILGFNGNDTLDGGADNDTLFGGSGNDSILGGDGADQLEGEDGNDTLDGGLGNDSMYGGQGADSLYGGDGDNALYGGTENDLLQGGAGNDSLEGGTGADTMEGGLGNDQYVVGGLGTIVRELAGEGSDTLRAAVSVDLETTNEIEFLSTTNQAGTTAIDLAGDNSANEIRGNDGVNRLTGRGGNDMLFGYAGNDTLDGGAGNDSLYGGDGTDSAVFGVASTAVSAVAGASSMTLSSSLGDDFVSNTVEFFIFTDRTLSYAEAALLRGAPVGQIRNGTSGADTIFGDTGDDTIHGDGGNDSLVGNDGNDSILGEAGNDILRGNAGADSLYGGDGPDTVYGGSDAADTMVGGAGDDTYYVEHSASNVIEAAGGGSDTVRTNVSFALSADAEVEFLRVNDQTTTNALDLTGSGTVNELRGNNGNNRLDGGGGEDSLRGFLGDDTYVVDSAGDLVFEADGEGDDTILTSISYTLSSTRFVEHVHAIDDASTDGIMLTGNQIGNDLRGNAGANRLSGADGADTLTGLGGNDTLYGGNGIDRAVFGVASTAANASAGASSLLLTTAQGVDFVSNDVEFFVFTDRTLTYAEAALLRGSVGPAPVIGTAVAENVNGTSDSELIQALGGNDWITPGTGSDTIDGGDGRDMVSFVNLPDTAGRTAVQYRLDLDLTAGRATTSGADVYELTNVERVTGTIFADRIKGSADADELRGLGDYDWFVATTGADTYDGGTGADMVSYVDWQSAAAGGDVDPLTTNGRPPSGATTTGVVVDLGNTANNTHLAAGHSYVGIERITGSGRADVFWGDGNENDFRGLGDYDWFVGSTGGRERYFGGDGVDTVTYFRSTAGVTASLSNGARVNGLETGYGTDGDAARDLYFEIENLVGSNHADRLTGNSGRNTLMGLDGDDFLFGGAGIDMLKGGLGDDWLDGGAGSDYAVYDGNQTDYVLTKTSSTTVTITGAEGTDSLVNVEYFRFADGDLNIWGL